MTDPQTSIDDITARSSMGQSPGIETSLSVIAFRYGVSTDQATMLYQQFLPQAENFNQESDLKLKTPPWKLALEQVVRELAKTDLGDLALGNYFEHWRRKETSRPLFQQPAPAHDRIVELPARESPPHAVEVAITNLYCRYMAVMNGESDGSMTLDSVRHLYTGLRRLNSRSGVDESTDAEILDELLMMLSFSTGDLPRGPVTASSDSKEHPKSPVSGSIALE